MNKHNITKENYQNNFVLTLSKSGENILSDLLNLNKNDDVIQSINYQNAARKLHILHMGLGVVGEAIEMLEIINDSNADATPKEELADALFYAVGVYEFILKDEKKVWSDYLVITKPSGYNFSSLVFAVNEYVVAAGNLADFVKKYIVYNDVTKLAGVMDKWEIFMICWSNLAWIYFNELQDVIDENVAKLDKRYSGIVYNKEGAINRPDKVSEDSQLLEIVKERESNPDRKLIKMNLEELDKLSSADQLEKATKDLMVNSLK